jgi:hypothetical protein
VRRLPVQAAVRERPLHLRRKDRRQGLPHDVFHHQEGAVESIHRILRYIFPKGKSLDPITQIKVEKAISHINSYRIRSNQFKTAYELTSMLFGVETLKKLKIEAIDPDSIHLTPHLVR